MATTLGTLRTSVRAQLTETSALFWTDAELLDFLIAGARDLWRKINDLYQHHFITVDITNVSLAASTSTLTGVPADVYRVVSLEPRTLGASSTTRGLIFTPKNWNDPAFRQARAASAITPENQEIFYTLFTAGAPVAAPTIRVAPQVTTAVDLTLVYNHTLATLTASSDNPIPGEADNALIAWALAYARAKEMENRSPDPEWLAIYGTEKTNLVQQLTPRQIQEPEIVQGMFENWDA
jgi:hypothetical protein